MLFRSASFFTTGCFSLPDLRNASIFAGSPLYFCALFLNDGPSLSAETEWHLRQPAFFTAASPALVSCACAPEDIASAVIASRTGICLTVVAFLLLLIQSRSTPQSRWRRYWTKGLWNAGPHAVETCRP